MKKEKQIIIKESEVGGAYLDAIKKAVKIRIERNKAYGSNFNFPVENYLWHLYQKIHRALYIVKNGINNYEKLEDTIVDLINYGIFSLIAVNKGNKHGI